MTDGPSSSTNETSSPAAQPVENITTLGYAVATVEEGSFVVLVVLSIAFCLVAAFFCFNVWYNHVHGYSILSATMRRFRKNKSALITAVVEEEDSDSGDDDGHEHDIFFTDDTARNQTMTPSTSSASLAGGPVHHHPPPSPSSPTAVDLLRLPTDLWLEVLQKTGGPLQHTQAVAALRASCRAMKGHLDGVVFWQSICRQAFAPWGPWMAAIGWTATTTTGGVPPSSSSSACANTTTGGGGGGPCSSTVAEINTSSRKIEKRAWHQRYIRLCRDLSLLHAALNQIRAARLLPPSSSKEHHTHARVSSAPSATALMEESDGEDDESMDVDARAPSATMNAPSASDVVDEENVYVQPRHIRSGQHLHHRPTSRLRDEEDWVDDEGDVAPVASGWWNHQGGDEAACGVHISVPCSTLGRHMAGRLSLWGYHTAEIPSLKAVWGGRGPTPTQVAKALMRKQQWRVDALTSRVAQSCRSQRRLVPVWRRVRPDELPCVESGAERAAPHDMQTLHSLLASGSAGAPECWVAHLAKGGVMLRALGAESSTTVRADLSCWMLVLTTARHALWIDFHDDLLLNGEGIGAGGTAFDMD